MEQKKKVERTNTKQAGNAGENRAANFLEKNGCTVIDRNFTVKSGEIDIIYLDGETICFGEVKYRKDEKNGGGEAAVDYRKQKQISRTSDYYRMKNELTEDLSYRFDVIAMTDSKINWIKNAFYYVPR